MTVATNETEPVTPCDSRLVHRPCPHCNSDNAKTILNVAVKEFARTNITYRQDIVDSFRFVDTDTFPIVRCAACGFQYAQKRLNDDLLARLYADVIDHDLSRAKIYKAAKRRMLTRYWLDILSILSKTGTSLENIKVLDMGCGWGDFLGVAAGPGVQVFGFEPDLEKATFATASGVHMFADIKEVEVAGPFDVILSNAVWEHVDDLNGAARTLYESLKPGGVGMVTVPNCEPRRIRQMNANQKKGLRVGGEFNPWEHINYFSHETLRRTVETAGLHVVFPQEELFVRIARRFYDALRILRLTGISDRIYPLGPAVYPPRLYVTRR